MRLLMLVAFVLFVIAAICFAVPTSLAGAAGLVWLASGAAVAALDVCIGGYVAPVNIRRAPPQ